MIQRASFLVLFIVRPNLFHPSSSPTVRPKSLSLPLKIPFLGSRIEVKKMRHSLLQIFMLVAVTATAHFVTGFQGVSVNGRYHPASYTIKHRLRATTADVDQINKTKQAVNKLKNVLEREYVSFFDPMQKEYYSQDVSFDDPMTSLSGVNSYQNNVDMLASRTLLGKFLFEDAGIVLHSVTGGDVGSDGKISNIITRWTLRVTAKVLPWKPTARFSGISVYEVSVGGSEGVVIDHQTDYWDSVNLRPNSGGQYQKVDKSLAIKDFLGQVKPDNAMAIAAGPEVPYQLLRRGDGYEVRRYPAYTVARIPYDRRDEGYDILATITSGANPLAPSLQQVPNRDGDEKTMAWPLAFAAPGQLNPPAVKKAVLDRVKDPLWSVCKIETIPSKVVAVANYADASVAPIVRKADKQLRDACKRDGLNVAPETADFVRFAQYDAIYSLGKRRGEVWIELQDGGHPWQS